MERISVAVTADANVKCFNGDCTVSSNLKHHPESTIELATAIACELHPVRGRHH